MTVFPLHIHSTHTPDSISEALLDALGDSIYICLIVIALMTLIEIFNVFTQGKVFKGLENRKFGQIVTGSALGLIPGCVGGFAGVSLYSHRIISFGALTAMLISTTGDEAFMMLAAFPRQALLLMLCLFAGGILTGTAIDAFLSRKKEEGHPAKIGEDRRTDDRYEIHECDQHHHSHEAEEDGRNSHGQDSHDHGHDHNHDHSHGHEEGHFHRISHFIREHVWSHIIKRHLPTIFAWTFGVLAIFNIASIYLDIDGFVNQNTALMIVFATLLGLIPESGPHMIFVTMYASGILPLPVLIASCISQDGHSCLPLIAENKRSWLTVKAFKTALALACGFIAFALL